MGGLLSISVDGNGLYLFHMPCIHGAPIPICIAQIRYPTLEKAIYVCALLKSWRIEAA